MNRLNRYLQTAIGHLGDHIGRAQKLLKTLVDIRSLSDHQISKKDETRIMTIVRNAVWFSEIPVGEMHRPGQEPKKDHEQ